MYDNNVANILINELATSTSWCWGGHTISREHTTGSYHYHEEKRVGICLPSGCGWKPRHPFLHTLSGCVGCTSEVDHANADFSYRGLFDPTGRLFYDHLNTYAAVLGTGAAYCRQYFVYRSKPPDVGPVKFFTWKHSCHH